MPLKSKPIEITNIDISYFTYFKILYFTRFDAQIDELLFLTLIKELLYQTLYLNQQITLYLNYIIK